MIHPDLRPLALPASELILDTENYRVHSEASVAAIAASLERFGQRTPLVAQRSEQGLIVRKGNGTLQAARLLGWTEVAVLVVDEDDLNATVYAIGDNRVGELSEWDSERLVLFLSEHDPRDVPGITDTFVAELELLASTEEIEHYYNEAHLNPITEAVVKVSCSPEDLPEVKRRVVEALEGMKVNVK